MSMTDTEVCSRRESGVTPEHAQRAPTTTEIVRDPAHSNGAPTLDGTGIRVSNVASASEHSGYSPDEIADFYPELSLAVIHMAIAYFYDHLEAFEDAVPAPEDDAAPA